MEKDIKMKKQNENNLPSLVDLVKDIGVYEDSDKFNYLLNQPPPKTWVKLHPYVKGHNYLPIDKVEYLLRKIFKEYRIEILRESVSFNGVCVAVRVHFKNPVTSEWSFHDGIGASALQTKGGKSPADMMNINNGALSMAYPIAKTLAIKDACEMFGKLFGSDLNRKDTLGASMMVADGVDDIDKEDVIDSLFKTAVTLSDSDSDYIEEALDKKHSYKYDKIITLLKKHQ